MTDLFLRQLLALGHALFALFLVTRIVVAVAKVDPFEYL